MSIKEINRTHLRKVLLALVWFYGILTIVGHLMPNYVYIYILNIYDI